MDDIQIFSGDHKLVVPEFSGGYLAGISSEIEGGLKDGNRRLDGDQRTMAKQRGYSMVDGVAPRLASTFPSSDEIRTETKSTMRAPTERGK